MAFEFLTECAVAVLDALLLTPEAYGKTKEPDPKWWQLRAQWQRKRARFIKDKARSKE